MIDLDRITKHKQPPRRLRIKQHVSENLRNRIGNRKVLSKKFFVAGESSSTETLSAVVERTRQERKLCGINLNRDLTGFCYFTRVTDEAKTGHIRHGVHMDLQSDLSSAT